MQQLRPSRRSLKFRKCESMQAANLGRLKLIIISRKACFFGVADGAGNDSGFIFVRRVVREMVRDVC